MIRRPPRQGRSDPLEVLETELAVLARTLELTARRSGLYDDLDRAFYLILRTLEDGGPRTINALAAELGLDASTVTRQVRAMESQGLVERRIDPSDRRTSIVAPTHQGRARMADVRHRRLDRIATVLGDWSAEDRSALGAMLARLNHTLASAAADGRMGPRPARRG